MLCWDGVLRLLRDCIVLERLLLDEWIGLEFGLYEFFTVRLVSIAASVGNARKIQAEKTICEMDQSIARSSRSTSLE